MDQPWRPSPARRRLSRLAVVLCSIYAVGISGFLALRELPWRWPPLFALVNSFVPCLFAPLLPTLLLALLVRSRLAWISSLVVLGLFLALYGPFFLPRLPSATVHTGDSLTLMTFNLGFDQSRPRQLVAAIAREDADIVAVQELIPPTADLLRAELSTRYPHTILNTHSSTTGLLSRYPILESGWFQPTSGRATLHAVVGINGRRVHVFAVHPLPPGLVWFKDSALPVGLNDQAQQRQILDLAERVAILEEPVLVLGDLNMSDQTRAYTRLSGVLQDAYREAGWGFGFTFPHGLRVGRFRLPGPLVRLDYIFHSKDFRTAWARVECGGGSDHCYLSAQLTRILASGDGK